MTRIIPTISTSYHSTNSSMFDQDIPFNYASSSSSRSPASTYAHLPRTSLDYSEDPYRMYADESRRSKRSAAAQRSSTGSKPQHLGLALNHPYDPYNAPHVVDDDDDDYLYAPEEEIHAFTSAFAAPSQRMARQSSDSSSSNTSTTTATTSSIAFAAPSQSSRRTSQASLSPPASPFWAATSSNNSRYALPSYSPPDPDSPFTVHTLFEDDETAFTEETDEEPQSARSTTSHWTRSSARATKSRRDSVSSSSKRRTSTEIPSSFGSNALSIYTDNSPSDEGRAPSPTRLESAKRRWDLLSLRIELNVYHAKKKLAGSVHTHGSKRSETV